MSQYIHESPVHRIGFDPSVSSPAPTQQGSRHGYFDDPATKLLLGLNDQDVLLNSGTYGNKELGQTPIEMHRLRDGGYDQRLMPFVPRHNTYSGNQLAFHNLNGQWIPLAASAKALESAFMHAVNEAQIWAERTGLNLPAYAYELVPKLSYKSSPRDPLFFFQFLPFFQPSAMRARWCRIARVTALLEGYINLNS
jgi:hypothetical protein